MSVAAALLLVHAGLGAVLLATARLPDALRHRLIQIAAGIGIVSAASLLMTGEPWRTVDLGLPQLRVALVGVAAAWLVVLVGERGRGDWYTAACIGVAATGTLLAAANRWVVPLLLFGACSTAALFLVLRAARPCGLTRFAIVAGDVLIACGLVEAALTAGTWERPESVGGWATWAIVSGTVIRTGALPLTGVWGSLGTAASPAVPLVVAGGFAIPLASLEAEPWVAAGLLSACLGVAGWTLLHRQLRIGLVAAWPVMLGLAAGFASSGAEASAGAQATLACAAVALWPWTVGRGQAERGILLSFLPLTVGSAAVGVAASAAFESASRVSGTFTFLPWALVVGLLPLGLLAGVLLGARVGGAAEPEDFEPSAVLALWALAAAGMLLWVAAPQGIGRPRGEGATLQLAAVIGAVAAGFLARGRSAGPRPAQVAEPFRHTLIEPRRGLARAIVVASLVIAIAGGVLVAWFAYDGLRFGFL